MYIGIDLGGSAVKVAAMTGETLVFTHCEDNSSRTASEILRDALGDNGFPAGAVEGVIATGLGAERCDAEALGRPVKRMIELPAIGRGATFLAGVDRAVIANTGTGTSFVRARDGEYTHVGGTGLGGGTLVGLGGRILGVTDPLLINEMADRGDLSRVDLTVGDLCSGAGSTLPPDLTAANLAKAADNTDPEDWAAGILNLVTQVVGTMCVLTCAASGMDTVIVTGALSSLPYAARCYGFFEKMYGLRFILPENGRYATAVGAVLTGSGEPWS